MRTIDGIRYISAKEYADLMGLTVGRVSQMKPDLPFTRFEEFGIDLINLDLIELTQNEKKLAQSKFETPTPLHTYSYKDLGNFFAKFSMDLVNFKSNADFKFDEVQNKANELSIKAISLEKEKDELVKKVIELESKNNELANNFQKTTESYNKVNSDLQDQINEFDLLHSSNKKLLKENEDLLKANNKISHELEVNIVENKNLLSQIKTEASFREEFKNLKELVMKKIK